LADDCALVRNHETSVSGESRQGSKLGADM